MTNGETKGRTALGTLEPVVFAVRTERGEAVVAALGHKALASVYRFAWELETVAHFQELGGLERRAWPPGAEGVARGLVIIDLDLALGRPDLVREAPQGWPWMVVVDERHDDGHAFAARDALAGRAAFVMVAWDPAGPRTIRCGRFFQVNSTATADVFVDWLQNPAVFELTREIVRGRLVRPICSRERWQPPPRKMTAEGFRLCLARDRICSVGALARKKAVTFERFLIVQPVREDVELKGCGPIVEWIEVPGREPLRSECRLLPGPAKIWPPEVRKNEFKPDVIERYLFVWGGEPATGSGNGQSEKGDATEP